MNMDDKDLKEQLELDSFARDIDIDEIPVPDELEAKIRERVRQTKKPSGLAVKVVSAAAALVFVFIGGVKASPSFAGYMANVPIIGDAVQWLQGDSGIRNASDNGYKNLGPIVLEKDGITLTLDNIFIDEDRLRFSAVASGEKIVDDYFTVTQREANRAEPIDDKTLKDNELPPEPEHKQPYIHISYPDFNDGGSTQGRGFNGKSLEMLAEKTFKPGELLQYMTTNPDKGILVHVLVNKGDIWSVDFGDVSILFSQKDILLSRVYPQNAEIAIEHGVIEIGKLIVSPTRMRLDVSFKMDEGYFFTNFENPEIWDDKGNVYKPEGLISSNWSETTRSIYFVPSTYFSKLPENLHFSFNSVRIGTEVDRTFTLSLNESYPKKLMYMGYEITVESVGYKNGELDISCRVPQGKLLSIQGLELSDPEQTERLMYSENSASSSEETTWFRTVFKVGKKDAYKFKYEYPGYLINAPRSCELRLEK